MPVCLSTQSVYHDMIGWWVNAYTHTTIHDAYKPVGTTVCQDYYIISCPVKACNSPYMFMIGLALAKVSMDWPSSLGVCGPHPPSLDLNTVCSGKIKEILDWFLICNSLHVHIRYPLLRLSKIVATKFNLKNFWHFPFDDLGMHDHYDEINTLLW